MSVSAPRGSIWRSMGPVLRKYERNNPRVETVRAMKGSGKCLQGRFFMYQHLTIRSAWSLCPKAKWLEELADIMQQHYQRSLDYEGAQKWAMLGESIYAATCSWRHVREHIRESFGSPAEAEYARHRAEVEVTDHLAVMKMPRP